MKPASKVTCMVIDGGGEQANMAIRLAEGFAKVRYCFPLALRQPWPTIYQDAIGTGMGVEQVLDWEDYIDETDLFVFPDNGGGAVQKMIRERFGKPCWGCDKAEELEFDRAKMKREMENLGLPLQPWQEVFGVDALEDYLEEHENQYVKIAELRGMGESFFAKNLASVIHTKINPLRAALGPASEQVAFICEDELPDREELGIDTWTMEGQYPDLNFLGIEIKNRAYLGSFNHWKSLSPCLTNFSEKIAPLLKKYHYRGAISTELRVKGPKAEDAIMIDLCCRAGIPPMDCEMEVVDNFPEVVWGVANGVMVEPEPRAKFVFQCIADDCSEGQEWLPIKVPKELRNHVKIRYPMRSGGMLWSIPQKIDHFALPSVVAWGDTIDEARDNVRYVIDAIDAPGLKFHKEALDEAEESIENTAKRGITMFNMKE